MKKTFLSILFGFIAIMFVIFAVEAFFMTLNWMTKDPRYSRSQLQNRLASRLAEESRHVLGTAVAGPIGNTTFIEPDNLVLHPYLGYVGDPTKYTHVNEFGWIGDPPTTKQNPNRIVIGMTGGSFAEGLFVESRDVLINELKKNNPRLYDKDIQLVSFASGGYKQPQQLLSFAYLLSLGYSFDAVVNLDGFNEVVLPLAENRPLRISPVYPRLWNVFAAKAIPLEEIKRSGKIELFRAFQQYIAETVQSSLLSKSIAPLLLWDSVDRIIASWIASEEQNFARNITIFEASYQQTGPNVENIKNADEETYLNFLVDYWAKSSEQMAQLAKANNVYYIHALQPNQYVQGSKPLSSKEQHLAIAPENPKDGDYPYQDAAIKGYPLLIAKGKQINKEKFVDMTMVFQHNTDTLYVDTCCHVNRVGYDIVARALAQELAIVMRSSP